MFLFHDNAHVHKALFAVCDMTSCGFKALKDLRGRHFEYKISFQAAVNKHFVQTLISRCNKCMIVQKDYIKKYNIDVLALFYAPLRKYKKAPHIF